jgi:AraC-like DNA-binding protein
MDDRSGRIEPEPRDLRIQQAADFLGASPAYLIGLLKQKELNYIVVETHRRIRMDDLLIYKEKMVTNSRVAMDELVVVWADDTKLFKQNGAANKKASKVLPKLAFQIW